MASFYHRNEARNEKLLNETFKILQFFFNFLRLSVRCKARQINTKDSKIEKRKKDKIHIFILAAVFFYLHF